jgi:very-short-patch-repair endonuclease
MRKPMHQSAAPHIFANAKKLRAQRTPAEIVLWKALREKQLSGFRFRQQHPIEDYILDFYCHFARLAVELDGEYHFTEEQQRVDDVRTKRLTILGIKVIRFNNQMVLHHLTTVLSNILQALIEETHTD